MTAPPRTDGGPPTAPVIGRSAYLHLVALAALALAQPVLDLLARTPEFFAARSAGRGDVLATLALTLLVAPLPWIAVAWLARRSLPPAPADRVVAGLVASLVGLMLLRGLALASLPATVAAAASIAGGLVAGWAYLRAPAARSFAIWLLPAVIVVPALFVLDPAVSRRLDPPPPAVPLHRSGASTPLVIILLDELSLASLLDRDEAIDARRYPHLAALAAQSTWFRNAAAASGDTATAVPAIVGGRVEVAGNPLQAERNLFTLLGDYPIYAAEGWSALCPGPHNLFVAQRVPELGERVGALARDLPIVWAALVTPPGWRRQLPPLSSGWDRFVAASSPPPRRGRKVGHLSRRPILARFLASIGPHDRVFYFGHFIFPHSPWEYLPDGRSYPCKPECYLDGAIEQEPWRAAQLYQRYLLQLAYTDRIVGDVFARLSAAGLYDRSLVVLLADHGTAFHPGLNRRSTVDATLGSTLAVPLFIKRPGQTRGSIVDDLVSTADLPTTIADLLGVRPPWPLPGHSLFDRGPRAQPRYVTFQRQLREVPPDLSARRRAAQAELMGFAAGLEAEPLRIGPRPDLIGASATASDDAPDLEVSLDSPERWRAVDPAADEVPVLVTATLLGPAPASCCTLAVAVNGTIGATTRSFRTAAGEHRAAVLLPVEALRPGANAIDVYIVDDPGSRLRHVRRRD